MKKRKIDIKEPSFKQIPEPLFEVLNFGRSTHIKICGIDFSRGVKKLTYKGVPAFHQVKKNTILVEIEVETLLDTLANITEGELKRGAEVLEVYLKSRKK